MDTFSSYRSFALLTYDTHHVTTTVCENWIWREAIVLNQHDKNEEVNIEFNERRWTMASGDQQMTIMVSVSV